MILTTSQLLAWLYLAVAILFLVILYHIIFIVVDVRKIVRRFETLSQEVEAVVLKPISMIDQILKFVVGLVEERSKKHESKKVK